MRAARSTFVLLHLDCRLDLLRLARAPQHARISFLGEAIMQRQSVTQEDVVLRLRGSKCIV
jgi:hypothetical protein